MTWITIVSIVAFILACGSLVATLYLRRVLLKWIEHARDLATVGDMVADAASTRHHPMAEIEVWRTVRARGVGGKQRA